MLIISTDALSFYLGFSAMSLAAYGLIVHRRGPGPRRAGRLYLQLAICGEMALLAGLMLRSHAADGDFSFAAWQTLPMDGLTLIKSLRGLPNYRTIPVLMLTTESSDTMKQQGRAAGATGWLVKPFDPPKLLEVTQKVLP